MANLKARGTVLENLSNLKYRIELEDGNIIICYLAGKMKLNRVFPAIGDRVEVVLDPYNGHATNRIQKRL